MNKILSSALLAGLLVGTAGAEVALPGDARGQVTLSWDKFNDLWEKLVSLDEKVRQLQAPGVTPPVPFALNGAAYRGEVRPGRGRLEAVFSLQLFDDKNWVKVPFLPASVAVTEALVDGKPFGLIQENGMHVAVLKGAGRRTLTAVLSFRAPSEEDAPELTLPVPATPMTALSVLLPQSGLEVEVAGAQGQETRPEGKGTRVTAALAAVDALRIRWHRALPAEKAPARKMYVDGETLFTVSEGALRGRWSLRYTVLHRGVQELSLRLPAGWNVLTVAAEGLEDWKVLDEEEGPRLAARFTHPRKGTLELSVEAERGLDEKEDLVPLPRVVPLDVERQTGVIAIQAKGAVEVTVPEAVNVQGLDPQELPPSLWARAEHPLLHAFRHTGKPTLSAAVIRHPDVPVLATTVDLANALTLVTRRGETVTRVQYHVRNRVKQHLAIALPASAELWSAFVAGEPVKPARLPDGAYRLPLRRSGAGGDEAVAVEIVYFQRKGALALAGRRTVDLPLPDAPVSRALWSLYLPPSARALRFDGDMDLQRGSFPMEPAPSWTGRLAKKALALGGLGQRKEAGFDAPAAAVELQSRLLTDSLNESRDAANRSGVFPVAFQIPTEGVLHHFARAMIVGESPRLSFTYAREGVFSAAWGLWWLALAGAAWRGRRFLGRLAGMVSAGIQGLSKITGVRLSPGRRQEP